MKIKILFYGFRHSHIDRLYQKVANSSFSEIAGCVESNDEAGKSAQDRLGATFSDVSYEQWLASDIDAVAVGTAYGERGDAIIKALSAGKHVIADKPICTSLEQLQKIRSLAEEKHLKIACMLDLRYLPQTLQAKEILASGELGEIRNLSFNGQHCLGYGSRPTWYFEKGMHGGTVNDLAIHGIDLVRMLTDMEITHVDAARVWNSYAYQHKDFRDSATFMARLENGAGVLADVSYSAPSQVFSMPTYWEFRIWCERGLLTFCYAKDEITVYREGESEPIRISCASSETDYLDEFYREISGDQNTMTENILRSTQATLQIQQVADEGQ